MKIIDLLNKIANGEEVPKKIKFNNVVYEYIGYQYCDETKSFMDIECYLLSKWNLKTLNDEVEIIEEDKKIENIGANNYEWNYKYDIRTPQAVVDNLELVRQKINEIIKHLNKGE